jgi:hypothetical protein
MVQTNATLAPQATHSGRPAQNRQYTMSSQLLTRVTGGFEDSQV